MIKVKKPDCINAIYNIFPDGDLNPSTQISSQADKYLTNMAVWLTQQKWETL